MDFIIRRKTFISMVFIAMVMLGVISYTRLPMELYPTPEMPEMVVMVNSSIDVSPEYMESQAIVPLEGVIGQLEGVKEISSMSSRQNGTIQITYNEGVNLKYAQLRLQEKINEAKADIPEEFNVVVNKVDQRSISNEFMSLQLLGEGGVDRLRNLADKEISDPLLNVNGIASVNIYGGREKTVTVEIEPDVAKAYSLTPYRIRQLFQNGQSDRTFVGEVYEAEKRFFVNISAEFSDISDIGNVVVNSQSGIKLKDIAKITFGSKKETSYSRVNGKDAITILLVNDKTVNLIDLSHKTREVIDKLNKDLKLVGGELIIQSDSAETMEKNIDQIIHLALVGGLLAVLILWFFLRNIRLVAAVSLSIPISVYAAFNFFYAFGITINSLSLVGMALAIGMLVDNSVVVLENIYRLASRGMNIYDAVVKGTAEVWRSILASTLTTICVFLPFFYTDDVVVKLIGRQIGISIVSTVLISFLVALLFIPMVTYLILNRQKEESKISIFEKISIRNRLVQVYMLLLKSAMRNPLATILGGVVIFFVTLFASLATQTQKLEEVEDNTIHVYVTMNSGATLDKTDQLVAKLENSILEIAEVKTVTSKIQEESATVDVTLKDDYKKIDKRDFDAVKKDVQSILDKNDQNAELSFEQSSSNEQFGISGGGGMNQSMRMERMMGIGTNEERIDIKGSDFEMMKKVADDMKYYLQDLDEISSVRSNLASNRPEVDLKFDPELTGRNNMAMNNVMNELTSFNKEVESGLKFKQNNEEYNIIIRTDTVSELPPMRMHDLEELNVQNSDSATYQLQDIAKIYYSSGISRINRVNQQKEIELTYRFTTEINDDKDMLEAARSEVDQLIASVPIPPGIAVQVVHEEDDYAAYYPLIAIAFFLIFVILASVFESFSTPFVLMFSIPLAAIGSLLLLIFSGNTLLSANTLTGFIILLGVVVNNGIILIDYSNILQKRGYRMQRALMLAGLARLRPIMITAITTIIAMVPLAMGDSQYVGIIGAPFALTVIGGLAFSTILTLVFIPTFYSGLNNALAWFRNLPLWLKLLQYTLFILGGLLIYFKMSSFLWQMVAVVLLITVVPGVVWFILNSLRKAQETVIPAGEPIVIRIQNLVKVYDRPARFFREWEGGKLIREHSGEANEYRTWNDLSELEWKVPLLGFVFYFTFFYLENGLWQFLFEAMVYFMALDVLGVMVKFFAGKGKWEKVSKGAVWAFHWFYPLLAIAYLYWIHRNIGGVIVAAVMVYMALAIDSISRKIHDEKININRLGRDKGLRRAIYQFVLSIPVIGKKNQPFRALKGVSLEIGNGMYGLLGPNGAGKSTLMRAICGINNQSYGKVWFNNIDSDLKREELQGLIGYLPQEFGMYENMTAWDYLQYMAVLKHISNPEIRNGRVQHVLEGVHMWENRDKKIGSFSGGMKQRIGIAQVLLHLPRILVVDEPTAGLDPRERIRFRNLLVELSRERIVIFSTHIIEDIASSCNQLAVLRKGRVQYVGSPRNMTNSAKGHVWELMINEDEFEEYTRNFNVAHNYKVDEKIRLRIVSKDQPHADAISVEPNLEDAYLWLQKGSARVKHADSSTKSV